ncbi:MAG: Ig-like domain-containing protein [bacterium]|nr:Ig-like domain-containing protein [bacterium]
MSNLTLKQKIMILVGIVGAILILIFQRGLYSKSDPVPQKLEQKQQTQEETKTQGEPQIVSTNPSPLNDATIMPSQSLEITFNQPAVNEPELKITIEPKADLKLELSNDKKTVTITPLKPLLFGQGYTLFISSEAKFAGGKTLGHEAVFHLKTISYKGV